VLASESENKTPARLNIIKTTKGGRLKIKNNKLRDNVILNKLLLFLKLFLLKCNCFFLKWTNVVKLIKKFKIDGSNMHRMEMYKFTNNEIS
jgi:hypothetical protein